MFRIERVSRKHGFGVRIMFYSLEIKRDNSLSHVDQEVEIE